MFKHLAIAAVAAALVLASVDADARRFGGGRSVGAQRDAVTQRQATPPQSAPNNAANPAANPAPAAAGATGAAAGAAARTGASRWMGPAAMIAGALGMGWLLSQMGAGGFLGMLAIGLLLMLALAFFARNMMRKSAAGMNGGMSGYGQQPQQTPAASRFEGTHLSGGASAPVMASGLAGGFGIPAGFDKVSFEENAKKQFVMLQAANDRGDLDAVRDFTTDELYNQIAKDVISGNKEATEVDNLQAELLGIESERGQYWASVRFTGSIREDGMVMGSAFSEVWNLTKPVDGSKGWLLGGIQYE